MVLVDIGNSITKLLGLHGGKVIRHHFDLKTALGRESFLTALATLAPETFYVAAVSSAGMNLLQKQAEVYDLDICRLEAGTMRSYCAQNGYTVSNISKLGADLFADIVGEPTQLPQLIVDCGTATKFLLVDEHKTFLGGMIFPGVASCSARLDSATDGLRTYNLEVPPQPYSLHTAEAVNAGAIYGTAYMLRAYAEDMKRIYPDLTVILTGGSAEILKTVLPKIDWSDFRFDPDHIFKGIARSFGIYEQLKECFYEK